MVLAPYSPDAVSIPSPPTVRTRLKSTFLGRLFAILQAIAHVWHPMQRDRSMAIP